MARKSAAYNFICQPHTTIIAAPISWRVTYVTYRLPPPLSRPVIPSSTQPPVLKVPGLGHERKNSRLPFFDFLPKHHKLPQAVIIVFPFMSRSTSCQLAMTVDCRLLHVVRDHCYVKILIDEGLSSLATEK